MKLPTEHEGFTRIEVGRLYAGLAKGAKKDKTLYRRYMRSPWWKQRRRAYVEANPMCQGCRVRPATQVHHIRYHFFQEKDEDLMATCGQCHMGFDVGIKKR